MMSLDLACLFDEHVDIVAKYLQGVLALHAGHRFFDVVLNVLREIEIDAGKFFELRSPSG